MSPAIIKVMAITRGARRAQKLVFVGFSAVLGFFAFMLFPSIRGTGGGVGLIPPANADAPVPGPGSDNNGPGGPAGPGCPGPAPGPCGDTGG